MPKQERYAIKQTLDNVQNELQRAQDKLGTTADPYKDVHPEYYQAFLMIRAMIQEAKNAVELLSSKI